MNPQTSPDKAFRGSKHLLTRYLEDFGRLGFPYEKNLLVFFTKARLYPQWFEQNGGSFLHDHGGGARNECLGTSWTRLWKSKWSSVGIMLLGGPVLVISRVTTSINSRK